MTVPPAAATAVTVLLEDVYDGSWTDRDHDVARVAAAAERARIRARIEAERDLFAGHARQAGPSLAANLAIRAGLLGAVLELLDGDQT